MMKQPYVIPIHYSCNYTTSRAGEQFSKDHALGYVLSGTMTMETDGQTQHFKAGELFFCRRNTLIKFTKHPLEQGEFRSVSILFQQEPLRDFGLEYGYNQCNPIGGFSCIRLPDASVLKDYMRSLIAYENMLKQEDSRAILTVKIREALLMLLKEQPLLRDVLFDFSEPGKIDLMNFMNKNYHFNVEMKRFAYLSGRSLSTFKRDFARIFQMSPSRWLLQRRLKEAHYMITVKKMAVKEIYLELGFEDLSHFSYAFKKAYGIAPSMIK